MTAYRKYKLVGGQAHGEEFEIHDSVNSIDIPVYTDEDRKSPASHTATYTRRELEVESRGTPFHCFGVATDDDTEINALAIYLIKADNRSELPSI